MNTRKIQLTPPSLSPNNIDQKIICIRAHRERIFRLTSENYNDKIIFHNYGQGGAGYSLLFGCVAESIRQYEQYVNTNKNQKNSSICVIGAGCYGLLTAIFLAQKGHDVHIAAKEQTNLPSFNAAGFFFPGPRTHSNPEEIALFRARNLETFLAYREIIKKMHSFVKKGAYLLPAYFDPQLDPGLSYFIQQGLLPAPKKVNVTFGNKTLHELIEYQTLFINTHEILSELQATINKLSIKIIKKTVSSFDQLDEKIIFNCAGLGAKDLANDKRVIPVQGHLIILKNQPSQQQMNYLLNAKVPKNEPLGIKSNELLYYAPKNSGLLGVTFLRGKKAQQKNFHEFDNLLVRANYYFGLPPTCFALRRDKMARNL